MKHSCSFFFSLAELLCVMLPPAPQAECPSYTHKDVTFGDRNNLPKGWFAYLTSGNNTGINISPLDTFNPVVVPNTAPSGSTYRIENVEISDDGQWLLYNETWAPDRTSQYWGSGYLIKKDGTAKTEIPYKENWNMTVSTLRFYRGSPYGTEVIYHGASSTNAHAVKVIFSADTATFGADRVFIDFGAHGEVFMSSEIGIAKDQYIGQLRHMQHNESTRTAYVTIPDSGRGTATADNIYQWLNDDWLTLYGCGHTMSRDGKLCVMNAGWLGSACSPTKWTSENENLQSDHKGFYITPFRRYTDPAIPYTANDTTNGISINWCPAQYRIGNYSANSFGAWQFGNSSTYVIGAQAGSQSTQYGVWLVEWSTNTWTLLTPPDKKDIRFSRVAVFFEDNEIPATSVLGRNDNEVKLYVKNRERGISFIVNTLNGASADGAIYDMSGRAIRQLTFDKTTSCAYCDYTDHRGIRIAQQSLIAVIRVNGATITARAPSF